MYGKRSFIYFRFCIDHRRLGVLASVGSNLTHLPAREEGNTKYFQQNIKPEFPSNNKTLYNYRYQVKLLFPTSKKIMWKIGRD